MRRVFQMTKALVGSNLFASHKDCFTEKKKKEKKKVQPNKKKIRKITLLYGKGHLPG